MERDEILKTYGLDFNIDKVQLEAPITTPNGIQYVKTDYYGLYNDKSGEVLNTVRAGYVVSQNKDIVDLTLEGMRGFGELSVNKAGSLYGGRKVYIQLAVEGYSKVGNDDVKRYVTIIDSNDGSTGLSVGVGDLTMSCQNQFYKFYKSGEAKWRHSASLVDKMSTMPSLIRASLSESLRMIELYNKFQSTKCSRDLAHQLVNTLVGLDRTSPSELLLEAPVRRINAMNSLYDSIEREMNDKGDNLWGLHSGVTHWTTHKKSAPTRENGRVESLMTGTNYRVNQASLEFASSMLV